MWVSRFAPATIVIALAVFSPVVAHAGAHAHYDAPGDVLRVTVDPETEEATVAPAPTRKHGDITKARAVFSGETIRLSASYRALVKQGDLIVTTFRVVTTKVDRKVNVAAGPGASAGGAAMTKSDGKVWKCPGLTHRIEYANAVVTVTFPRSCLAVSGYKPGALRFGVGAAFFDGPHLYLDDGFDPGTVSTIEQLNLSPKVSR